MEQDEMGAPEEAATPEMLAALAAPQVEQAETPEKFLSTLSETLKTSDDVDADLAGILSDHLLTITPHANAVANATATPVHVDRDDHPVYRTVKGKGSRFHAKEGCSHATVPLSLRDARARGLTACHKCCACERPYVD